MAESLRKPSNRTGRYYAPRAAQPTGGVKQLPIHESVPFDMFVGSMDDLVASGFAESAMFPGQPGACKTSQSYRPIGAEEHHRERRPGKEFLWHRSPGYMEIKRRLDGTYSIKLTASYETQDARHAAWEAKCAKADAEQQIETRKSAGALVAANHPPMTRDEVIDQLLETFAATYGLDAIRSYIARAQQAVPPRPRLSHLRVAWSAPAAP